MAYVSTIAFIIIVLFFLWRGYQKGLIGSVVRVLSCVAAYPMAIIFTNPLAKIITKYSALDGLMVYFIAGSLILLTVCALVDYVGNRLLNNFFDNAIETESSYNISKISGAVVGVLVGCFIGLLTAYIINFKLAQQASNIAESQAPIVAYAQNAAPNGDGVVESYNAKTGVKVYIPQPSADNTEERIEHNYQEQTAVQNTRSFPPVNQDSFVDSSAKKLVSRVAGAVVNVTAKNPTAAQITKVISADPQVAIDHLNHISNDQRVIDMFLNPNIQAMLNRGDTGALLNDVRFKRFVRSEHIQALLSADGGSKSRERLDQDVAEVVVKAWSRVNEIKNDPRVVAIINDPEFQKQLNSANTMSLMANPKLKNLLDIIAGNDSAAN